jgi:hypothetical protein
MRYSECTNIDFTNPASSKKDFIQYFPTYDADVEAVRAWLLTWFTNQNINPGTNASIEDTISQLSWTGKSVRQLSIMQLFADFRGCRRYGARIIYDILRARELERSKDSVHA